MKIHLIVLIFFVHASSFSQTFQKDINDQVWKPFITAFDDLNTEAFMAIHSKDIVRVSRDDGRVMGYEEYAKVCTAGNHNDKVNKAQRKIELRFTERWINHDLACEAGVYKTQTIRVSGKNTTSYGKFLVTLHKEKGMWKILMDSDTSEAGTVSDKDFLMARPME
jgi:ketosteroid isomerase-like protein